MPFLKAKSMLNRFRIATSRKYKNFNPAKQQLIDHAFTRITPAPRSFADLGGVWNVDAAYTFYSLDTYDLDAAYLVDTNYTEPVLEMEARYPTLRLITGNFGDPETIDQLGRVDAVFFFDVLLHQVKPDWDEVLNRYSEVADCMLIFNQQYTNFERTVRLLDLGEDEYFANVPHEQDHPSYKDLFPKMQEPHPQHGRIWRDIHAVWQWGITDADLSAKMAGLGYQLQYFKNWGPFGRLANVENHAFLFQRT